MYMEMSDKVNLYVKISGEGIPCLFIHGGPGEGSLDFETLGGNSLENFMQVIYFDQRGCARSEGNVNDDYSINRMIEDIEEIRKKLGISKWIVLAHSFGGIIAVNYVYKYQNFVHKLVLLNSTLFMEDSLINQLEYGAKLLAEENLQYGKGKTVLESWQNIINKLIEKNLFYKLQYTNYESFLTVNEVSNKIEKFNTVMANQAFSNIEYFKSYFNLTKQIFKPVLIITGNEDYAIGTNHYKNFEFPNKKIKVIEGKHMLYFENNEEVTNIIRAFVK
ncbi:proline iminopeptidase [Clostridium collagenovorans DSM 3089]|uniref:Proline iminopeptidase n=1 Tax=Clostridium collagenovorans DSM 3089 TaxID=1121306 RepID=A0A1M5VC81_9CLOT|nr:alpha/beta hydrolase [Clostridium collagenovorans]SHH72806.1 proline iminopeptidase [Clostridium collagenovorans DSM 3089]